MRDSKTIEIKENLMQLVGALTTTVNYTGSKAKHLVVANLTEISLDIAKDKDSYNIFVAKPVLKATSLLIQDRIKELERINLDITTKSKFIKEYNTVLNILNKLIENTKEN